jgi:hypothetical protein
LVGQADIRQFLIVNFATFFTRTLVGKIEINNLVLIIAKPRWGEP